MNHRRLYSRFAVAAIAVLLLGLFQVVPAWLPRIISPSAARRS